MTGSLGMSRHGQSTEGTDVLWTLGANVVSGSTLEASYHGRCGNRCQVAQHIYTGPSTALGSDPQGMQCLNLTLIRMSSTEATHIVYAAVQVGYPSP